MPIRYLNHSMHVHTKRDIWVALLFYMTYYQTITNIVIFTQNKQPRFLSILEKQVNYICLEYKKLLSWRTSLQAAIDHLSVLRLPLWACTLHNPNKGCRAQPMDSMGLPYAAHSPTCTTACNLARMHVAMVRTVLNSFRLLSILQVFESSMLEHITTSFKQ